MEDVRHPVGTPPVAAAIDLKLAEQALARYWSVLGLRPRPPQISQGPLAALTWLQQQPEWPQDDFRRHYEVLACGFPGSDPSRVSHWDVALKETSGPERNRMWQAIEARFRSQQGPHRFAGQDARVESCLSSGLDCWYYAMIERVLAHAPAQPGHYVELVSALAQLFEAGVWRLWLLPEVALLAPRVSLPEPAPPKTKRSRQSSRSSGVK